MTANASPILKQQQQSMKIDEDAAEPIIMSTPAQPAPRRILRSPTYQPRQPFGGASPIVNFASLKSSVYEELNHRSKYPPILLNSLPRFSRIINGLREGELTVFTGPTGCGKTTILSQMSLDYAMQGVPVLWGSFEIRNSRLAQVMMQQMAQQPLVNEDHSVHQPAIEEASNVLSKLPIGFMDLFGSTDLNTVLNTMELSLNHEYSQSRMSLPGGREMPRLIILDNLQFMLSGQGSNSLDRWELMDRALASLRHFCSYTKVHLVLVVHPRKEADDTPLCLASVSGTAKATQEADNVVIVQKLGEKRYLDVKKNRFYGELGRVRLAFDPKSRMIIEITDEEARASEQSAPKPPTQ